MASHMRTSRAGLDVIKTYEGFRPRYQRLPNGRWIVGYGHVLDERGGTRISEAEAETLLREYDLPPVERLVSDCVMAPLNQNEFDGLVSLAFNLGAKSFVRSDVVAELNAGNRIGAAEAFEQWKHAKIGGKVQVVDALVRRRAAEKALFLKAPGQMAVASSRIVKPLNERPARAVLPVPREIRVERQQIEVEPTTNAVPESTRNALKEASDSVREQMVRILGENGSRVSEAPDTTDGASPDEIRAAVSELVQGAEKASGPVKSVWPTQEDLPPPPFFESVGEGAPILNQSAPSDVVIDDLEEIAIDPDDIDKAVELNGKMEAEAATQHLRQTLPFAVLSSLGLVLFGFGLARILSPTRISGDAEASLGAYVAPSMVLVGSILFVSMAYYGVRELIRSSRA